MPCAWEVVGAQKDTEFHSYEIQDFSFFAKLYK